MTPEQRDIIYYSDNLNDRPNVVKIYASRVLGHLTRLMKKHYNCRRKNDVL
jgi:hypothetical protein